MLRRGFKRKKKVPSFLFSPIPKTESLEVLESFLLLQILTVVVCQELETKKKELKC